MSNPHYLPAVCIQVSIINFTVTFEGLQEQLLSSVVKQVILTFRGYDLEWPWLIIICLSGSYLVNIEILLQSQPSALVIAFST